MSESEPESKSRISCSLGCFGCLLEIIGFIGICYICGCEWSRNCVLRCVSEIHGAWVGATSTSSKPPATPYRN